MCLNTFLTGFAGGNTPICRSLHSTLSLLPDSQQVRSWEGKILLNGGEKWLQPLLPHRRFHWLPSGINEKWQSPRCLGGREEARECGIWRDRCRPFQSVVERSNYIHLFTPHTLSMDGQSVWATAARWTTEGDGFWIQRRKKMKPMRRFGQLAFEWWKGISHSEKR